MPSDRAYEVEQRVVHVGPLDRFEPVADLDQEGAERQAERFLGKVVLHLSSELEPSWTCPSWVA